ncbi:MAG TPA: hypothetical protein VGF69_13580 [Thermoanaerobaculia bacterium]|jgi:hypothetical protein
MRRFFVVLLVGVFFCALFAPATAVTAGGTNTVLTSYYIFNGTCLEWIGEREVNCDGGVLTQGTSFGATHKVVVQFPCDSGLNYVSFWERASDQSPWVQIYALPGSGYCGN